MESLREFGFLLKDVSRLYSRNFERHAAGLGLTLGECRVITYLSREACASQARLAYLTETDPMTLGRILRRMEAAGLIERRANLRDRRVLTLSLRPPALDLLKQIRRLSERSLEESFAGISPVDRDGLVKLMGRVHANLDALLPGLASRGAGRRRSRASSASSGRSPASTRRRPSGRSSRS